MRRSRAEEDVASKRRSSEEIIRPLPPEPIIDWGLAFSATPRCCVCGESYIEPPGEDLVPGKHSNKGIEGASPLPTIVRKGPGGDESFVVLPDSAPVLSESYFSLSRTGSASRRVDNDGIATVATHTPHEMSLIATDLGVGRRHSTSMLAPDDGSTVGGPRMLESGYASILGGWTGSGFGTASSMLESIVQISHAGLSDNVRRESILHNLSKRSARPFSLSLGVSTDGQEEDLNGEETYGSSQRSRPRVTSTGVPDDEVGDPTLCYHCYASLLDRIDEHCRLAERDTLAYRDFLALLDNIADDLEDTERKGPHQPEGSPASTAFTPDTKSNASADVCTAEKTRSWSASRHREEESGAAFLPERPSGVEMQGEESVAGTENRGQRVASSRDADARESGGRPREGHDVDGRESELVEQASADVTATPDVEGSTQREERTEADESARTDSAAGGRHGVASNSYPSPPSPFVDALKMAEQTSAQLRAELKSLESQREALCTRGSETWAMLAELAYTRGVLGDECRELLKSSAEVAQAAQDLTERPALSDIFTFRHVDGFPSINGYRLGRVPDERRQLHWNEINAAWGQAVFLVRCVSNAIDFHSKRFRLVPLNCSSRVVELAIPNAGVVGASWTGDTYTGDVMFSHSLFSSGRRGDDKHRLSVAIKAFLACSTEVIAQIEKRLLERRSGGGVGRSDIPAEGLPRGLVEGLPYQQTEDGVGGISITSLKSPSVWKAWLCQLVKNLEWSVKASSSLCVT